MSHNASLIYMYKTNQGVMKSLIDDITEDESLVRGPDKHNHIRWLVGHMLYSNYYANSLLGGEDNEWEKLKDQFGAGSQIAEDGSVYPPMRELRDKLYALYDELINRLESESEKDLTEPVGDDGKKSPKWRTLTFLAMHDFYHGGQVVNMRHSLGRERPFG